MACNAIWVVQCSKYVYEGHESSSCPVYRKIVVVYFDDILVSSLSMADHIVHLREVLLVLRRDQLYATLKKCEFGSPHVHFFGVYCLFPRFGRGP